MTDKKKGKKIWKSKTLWANLISIAALVIQTKTGYVIEPATQAMALGLLNGGLRFLTKEAILTGGNNE